MHLQKGLAIVCFWTILHPPIWAQEWTRFRGPNGSGLGQAHNIPLPWTEKDYNWKVKLAGTGHSSPVLWGDRIFVTSGEETRRIIQCLSAVDGKTLWQREYPGKRHGMHKDNSFASATPAVDGRRVYLCWGSPLEYLVMALDHDGKEIWRTDLGPYKGGHGFGASPIVHEGLVIVPNDQDGASSVAALDCEKGDLRWKVSRRCKSNYATPCLYHPNQGPAQVILTSWEHGVTSIDVVSGKITWELDIFDKGHIESAIASPFTSGDLLIATCGWLGVKHEVAVLRPRPGAPLQQQLLYRVDRAAPLVPTPLVKDGLLFLWSDRGVVTCAEVQTGNVVWQERLPGNYYSSPVCVSNNLYCPSREGDMTVLAAGKKFELIANIPLGEGSHSTPALAGGKMYVRTFSHLMSLGGKR